MEISPIKTAADHANALQRIAELISAAAGSPEGDDLDILATLVEAYEKLHFIIDVTDPRRGNFISHGATRPGA